VEFHFPEKNFINVCGINLFVTFDFTFNRGRVYASSSIRTIYAQGCSVDHRQLKHAKIRWQTMS
jgi:hypothetical protein